MPKVFFYTGAGMSRESGFPTFRDGDGLWNALDVETVADLSRGTVANVAIAMNANIF